MTKITERNPHGKVGQRCFYIYFSSESINFFYEWFRQANNKLWSKRHTMPPNTKKRATQIKNIWKYRSAFRFCLLYSVDKYFCSIAIKMKQFLSVTNRFLCRNFCFSSSNININNNNKNNTQKKLRVKNF